VGHRSHSYVVAEKRKWTLSVPISVVHLKWTPVEMRLC